MSHASTMLSLLCLLVLSAEAFARHSRRVLVPRKSQDFTCQQHQSDTEAGVNVIRRNFATHAIECVADDAESLHCKWYESERHCNEAFPEWNSAALQDFIVSCLDLPNENSADPNHWCFWRRKFWVPLEGAPSTPMEHHAAPTPASSSNLQDDHSSRSTASGEIEIDDVTDTIAAPLKIARDVKIVASPSSRTAYAQVKRKGQVRRNFTRVYQSKNKFFVVDVDDSQGNLKSKRDKTWNARIIPSAAVAHELHLWPVRQPD